MVLDRGQRVICAGGDQWLTPWEMLRFGIPHPNGGELNDQQIVAEEWIEGSAAPYPGPDNIWVNHFLRLVLSRDGTWGPRGYSYAWWTHAFSRRSLPFSYSDRSRSRSADSPFALSELGPVSSMGSDL